jgi:HK97 family phage prohead protease
VDTKIVGTVFAEVKALDTKDPSGAFEAVLSTTIVDRDGEIVDAGAFNPLPKSIPIHVNHQFMDVAKVVGRGIPYYDGDILKVKGTFASTPDAQMVRTLVAEGMVQTMSIGFHQPTRDMKDGVPHVTGGQLIEASFVSVPANTDALVTMAKTFDTTMVLPTLKALSDKIDELAAFLKIPAATDPEEKAAAPVAAADPPADVPVGQVYAALMRAQTALLTT